MGYLNKKTYARPHCGEIFRYSSGMWAHASICEQRPRKTRRQKR